MLKRLWREVHRLHVGVAMRRFELRAAKVLGRERPCVRSRGTRYTPEHHVETRVTPGSDINALGRLPTSLGRGKPTGPAAARVIIKGPTPGQEIRSRWLPSGHA